MIITTTTMCSRCPNCPNDQEGCPSCAPWRFNGRDLFYHCIVLRNCDCPGHLCRCSYGGCYNEYKFLSDEEIAAHREKADKACAEYEAAEAARKAAYAAEAAHTAARTATGAAELAKRLAELNAAFAAMPTFSEEDRQKLLNRANALLATIRITTDKRAAKAALVELLELYFNHKKTCDRIFKEPIYFRWLRNEMNMICGEIISPDVKAARDHVESLYQKRKVVAYAADGAFIQIHNDVCRVALTVYAQRRWELRLWRVWNAVSGLFARAA